MTKGNPEDPKRLVHESYRIEGITKSECRSIFLDWAFSLPLEQDSGKAITALLTQYRAAHPDHPMTEILVEGQNTMPAPRRRGGWRSRPRH
tara:strand:- start:1737 stop:2009 length:273 start_codon:yes stop_codon:yes gene_type:complete